MIPGTRSLGRLSPSLRPLLSAWRDRTVNSVEDLLDRVEIALHGELHELIGDGLELPARLLLVRRMLQSDQQSLAQRPRWRGSKLVPGRRARRAGLLHRLFPPCDCGDSSPFLNFELLLYARYCRIYQD